MHTIEIQQTETTALHCPLCGTATLSESGDIAECPHLVYVSSSETLDSPWYDAEGLGESEGALTEFLEARLGKDAFAFVLFTPAPSGLEVLVAYRQLAKGTP